MNLNLQRVFTCEAKSLGDTISSQLSAWGAKFPFSGQGVPSKWSAADLITTLAIRFGRAVAVSVEEEKFNPLWRNFELPYSIDEDALFGIDDSDAIVAFVKIVDHTSGYVYDVLRRGHDVIMRVTYTGLILAIHLASGETCTIQLRPIFFHEHVGGDVLIELGFLVDIVVHEERGGKSRGVEPRLFPSWKQFPSSYYYCDDVKLGALKGKRGGRSVI